MTGLFLAILTLSLPEIYSEKILGFFPVPSVSHQVVFRPLMQELARRGHELTIVTTDPAFNKGETPENYTEIDVHDLSYKVWRELFVTLIDGAQSNFDLLRISFTELINIFDLQLNTVEVQNLIKSETKFDLIFVEAAVRSTLILSRIFNASLIQFSSFGAVFPNYQTHGSPSHPLVYGEFVQKRIFNMSLWEKFQSLYAEIDLRHVILGLSEQENAMIKKNLGPNAPTIDELENVPELLFLNVNPIFEGNRPVPPSVIHLGGLHIKPLQDLPHDLETYLESSKNGVIYMSFGTNVDTKTLPKERVRMICRVFSRLHFNIIWKWNGDTLDGNMTNVMISKWLPQSDLLRHPKMKLFITQGGLQSTDEAIAAGVPMVTTPMLGDQWWNAERHVKLGIGIQLDFIKMDEEIFENAINKVINDASYKANILRLRELMQDQPQSPLERAVWWTEYVLRHGGAKHLRSPMANISWSEYLMLDVVGALLLMVTTALIFFICGIRYALRFFSKLPMHGNIKKKKS